MNSKNFLIHWSVGLAMATVFIVWGIASLVVIGCNKVDEFIDRVLK